MSHAEVAFDRGATPQDVGCDIVDDVGEHPEVVTSGICKLYFFRSLTYLPPPIPFIYFVFLFCFYSRKSLIMKMGWP